MLYPSVALAKKDRRGARGEVLKPMTTIALIIAIGAFIIGIGLGYIVRQIVARFQKRSLETDVKEMLLRAREEATRIIEEAEHKFETRMHELRSTEREHELEFKKTKDFFVKKESILDTRQADMDKEYDDLKRKIEDVRILKEKIAENIKKQESELINLAGMTREQARDAIIADAETKYAEDIMVRLRKLDLYGEEKYKERARSILVNAIHCLASSTAHESTTTTVRIENEDVKGKIIGKEGRNIRTFERITGVELIVDDSTGEINI